MESKKRSSDSVVDVENFPDANVNAEGEIASPVNKKMKKDKKKVVKMADGDANAPSSSVKPMERKKKRKALDKERHLAALENEETKPKPKEVDLKDSEKRAQTVASSSGELPEFHLGVFQELAVMDVTVREAAVERLVTELQEIQRAYEIVEDKELVECGLNMEADKDDGLDNCAPSVRYALRRLIRGTSSSREFARQGFALGLTVVVSAIHSIRVDSLLKLIVNLLEVSSSTRGQELKDCLLGRLFSYGALAQSGRITEEWNSDHNTPLIKEFTSAVISHATKKRYLQEPAVAVILDMIEKLPTEAVLSHVLEAPGLHDWFEGATEVGNPDALLLALRIRERISVDSMLFGNILPYPFSPSRLFASEHLSTLVNSLKESTFCQPRFHSVWPVLVNILLPEVVMQAEDVVSASNSLKKHKKSRRSSSSEEELMKSVKNFCEVVIEGSLLLSSHDRKHLALDILLLLLPRLPASFVPIVLSYKIVQCLMDILYTSNSWLYKVAQKFLKELADWVGEDDVRRVAVIVALQKHSNGKFDCASKTKTVKALMSEFKTESGCMLFVQNLENIFVDEGHASEEPSDQSQTTDDNSEMGSVEDKESVGGIANSDFLRTWIVESLPSILKYLKLDFEAKYRVQKEILKFLAVQGLFSASLGSEVTSFELQEKFRWPKAAISSAICRMCVEQIQLLLASAQKMEVSRSVSKGPELNDLGSYFMRFLSTLRNIPSVSLFRTLSDEDEKAFGELQEMENKLSREERNCEFSSDANKLHAMRYLLIQLLLQLLLRPGEFSEAVSELIICCKKAFRSSDLLDSSGDDEVDDDEKPELMDVLVDTLLSLLPQSSASMQSAIEQVFKYFSDGVTDDGLLRMLRVIKKDLKPARHQGADSEDDDVDDDDEEDFLGIEEDEEIDEAETGETGESEEQTDDSEAIADVEGAGKYQSEDSDDSDGGVDDDTMFRMDLYLGHILKQKKNQAGGDNAQSQLLLFKLRVLSLLEIYLHENPGKPQVLLVYSTLSRAVNLHIAEISEQLGQRICGIIQRKIFKARDFPKGDAVQLSTLESLLEKNLKLASKPLKSKKSAKHLKGKKPASKPSEQRKQSAQWKRQKMIVSLAQNSTFWILKIIDARSLSESELQRVFDILKGALAGYFESKKSQIKSGFLKEIFQRRPWLGQQLFGFFLEKWGNAKSEFRRVEALDLIMVTLKSITSPGTDEKGNNSSKKILRSHLKKLGNLVKELVTNMPENKSRAAEVSKFCGKLFQMVTTHDLTKSFLKELDHEVQAACESKLGERFLSLKRQS